MRDAPRGVTVVRQLPEFLDAEAVDLRLAPFVQPEPLCQHFGQRTARAFAEHCDLRPQVNAGLEVGLRLPFFVYALVARAHANYAVLFVVKHLRARKLREDVDARLLTLLAKPGRQAIQRDYVITVVLERRRRQGRLDGARLRQVQKIIFVDGRFERRALLHKIRHQLLQRARVHDCARQKVRADVSAFFNHADFYLAQRLPFPLALRDLLVVLAHEPRQVQSARQIRRPRADEDHVHFQGFSFQVLHSRF